MAISQPSKFKGALYCCPVCGAEIVLLAPCPACFAPRCCNQPMEPRARRAAFFVCDVCGVEVAAIGGDSGSNFAPRCCAQPMRQLASKK